MTYPHEQKGVVKFVGGLPVTTQAKRITSSTSSPSDARELAALRSELDEIWRAIGAFAPSGTPADAYGVIHNLDAQVRGFASRLDALEKRPFVDKSARDWNARMDAELTRLVKDFAGFFKTTLTRIEQAESEIMKQRDAINETVRTMATKHKDVAVLAEWQLSTACERLVSEFRDHVREH